MSPIPSSKLSGQVTACAASCRRGLFGSGYEVAEVFVVTCKPLGLHVQCSIKWAAVTPTEGLGDGGLGPRQPNAKRGPLSAVPDARRAEVNIKKLPLISHKAAANGIDLCMCRVRKLEGRTNGRRRRNPSTRNVRQSL